MPFLMFLLLALLAWVQPAPAAIRYVDTNSLGDTCNDGNAGTSPSAPKCSLNASINAMSGGDTLYLRQGSYGSLDYTTVCLPSGSSYGAATIVASYPGETAILASMNLWPCGGAGEFKYVIFDRLLIDGGTTIADTVTLGQGSHHVRFQNGEVKNAWSIAFSLFGIGENQFVEVLNTKIHDIHRRAGDGDGYAFYIQSSDNLIEGCEMYNLDAYGVQFYNGYTFSKVDRNIVRNNRFYNTGFVRFFGGITVNHGTDNKIYNNIFYNTFGVIDVVRNARNTLVANNTLYNNQAWGIRLDIGTSNGPNTTVKNNILYNSQTIEVGNAPGAAVSNNLTTDPHFVNAGGGDFTLQAGSPAINAGTTLAAVPTDYAGVARPQGPAYDIGAYEYVGPE